MPAEDFICPRELRRFMSYQPEQPGPTPANLKELDQLLHEIWGKEIGKTEADQRVLAHFQGLCGLGREVVEEHEQRILRQLDKKQPIFIGFNPAFEYKPGRPSVLSVLVMNPTPAPFREVRIRFHSPDLLLVEHAQPRPIKMLESHDAIPVHLHYRAPDDDRLASLALEVDICDQRGEWHAYNSRHSVLLNFPGHGSEPLVRIRITSSELSQIVLPEPAWALEIEPGAEEPKSKNLPADADSFLPSLPNLPKNRQGLNPEQMLPIELQLDTERTRLLQAESVSSGFSSHPIASRGTLMSRAVLLSQNSLYAPERIELVARPFIVLGRYNEKTQRGFGDFSLGFLPDYGRISRLQCAVCATADGMAVMHASGHRDSYTGLNTQKLIRGVWQRLEAGDSLDICGLYQLKVALAWSNAAPGMVDLDDDWSWGEELGECLVDVINLVRQVETTGADSARQQLKARFDALKRMQEQAAKLNGADSSGLLLYARFYREDAAQYRITHIYLPKVLPIGSSPQAGLRINAPGVAPRHAELLFKDGLFWIKNLMGEAEVRVSDYNLGSGEVLPLQIGDSLDIGSARFTFEGY